MSDLSRSKSRPLQRGACRRRIGTRADIVALATTPKVGGESRRQTATFGHIRVQKFISATFGKSSKTDVL